MIKPLKPRTTSSRKTSLKGRMHMAARPEFQVYHDQPEMTQLLNDLDGVTDGKSHVIFLVMHEAFEGNFPSMIRRENPGQELIVTGEDGRMPGLVSRHDLTFHASALGWEQVSFVHDFNKAVEDIRGRMSEGEQVIFLLPDEAGLQKTLKQKLGLK